MCAVALRVVNSSMGICIRLRIGRNAWVSRRFCWSGMPTRGSVWMWMSASIHNLESSKRINLSSTRNRMNNYLVKHLAKNPLTLMQ